MDEVPRTSSSESSAFDTGAWIGRVVIAVLLAEAIWGFIVSITNGLVLPLLARTMGADAQSSLYLGKGDLNVPALFTAVLELCFAGIVAVVLNSLLQRKPKVVRRPVKVSSVVSPIPTQPVPQPPAPPMAAVAPVPATVSARPPATPTVIVPVAGVEKTEPERITTASATPEQAPDRFWSPPEPPPQPKATLPPPAQPAKVKPAKPKPPKEVYYNIVGEPINPTEDD
jgi:hypothetical protein